MTIHLPKELESSIEAAVHGGLFTSVDDAMAEAARLLIRKLDQSPMTATTSADPAAAAPDPIWGLMRDDAELMDEIVADAYRHRSEETWREVDL